MVKEGNVGYQEEYMQQTKIWVTKMHFTSGFSESLLMIEAIIITQIDSVVLSA